MHRAVPNPPMLGDTQSALGPEAHGSSRNEE
jgi:hypothetical protein